MTSQGRPYARFDRALRGRDAAAVRIAARECENLSVTDALRIVLMHADVGDPMYSRLAARWVTMAARDAGAGLEFVDGAVSALLDLGQDVEAGCQALAEFAMRFERRDVTDALRRHEADRARRVRPLA